MIHYLQTLFTVLLALLFAVLLAPWPTHARQGRVLLVSSYHPTMAWEREVEAGVADVLGGEVELRIEHLDTLYHWDATADRSLQAYMAYTDFDPDGIIAVDDPAQEVFVRAHLLGRFSTPVVFCGVEVAPRNYGYLNVTITGVLEHKPIHETIALAQALDPTIRRVAFLYHPSPAVNAAMLQLQRELPRYPAQSAGVLYPQTPQQALDMVAEIRGSCDALYIVNLEGMTDESGNRADPGSLARRIQQVFAKPVLSSSAHLVRAGITAGVCQSGHQQGAVAAGMLKQLMDGHPPADLPVRQERQARVMLNADILHQLGITPRPWLLRLATITGGPAPARPIEAPIATWPTADQAP